MRTSRIIALTALPWYVASVAAQDTLALDQAIALALANEHGIRIARIQADAAAALAIPGNAGLVPRIDAGGRGQWSEQYTRLDFTEGFPDQERSGVQTTVLSGQLGLAYTLFNGMANFAAYDRAKLEAELADLNLRAQVEATLAQVVVLYYGLAALDEDVRIAQRALDISAERHQRQQDRAALGAVGRLDALNALVDLQSDSTALVLAAQRRERTARDLNVLLGRAPSEPVAVSRHLKLAEGLDEERLVADALRGNVQVAAALNRIRAAEADERIAGAARWPRLDLTGAYAFSDQRTEVGIVLGTYNQGLNGGLTLSVPLFEGGRVRSQAEAARLRAEGARLAEEQARLQVERDVRNAHTTWRAQREVLRLQREAVATARLNFERSRELHLQGQLTGIQFRQAQLDLEAVLRRTVVAGFDAKVAELQLLRASGGLLPALGLAPDAGR
jgi:outer membrane protein TolC